MKRTIVYVDDLKISATNFKNDFITNDRKIISFDFEVKSEESHEVTTLLYKNSFVVRVPDEELEFGATIKNYYTSITDLYAGDAVADFHLELIETDLKGIS